MTEPACYICGITHGLQGHHITPQTAGGEDGPVVNLCGTCHQTAHAQALNILSKQPNRQLFPDALAKRAAIVVRFIVVAIRRERENPDASNPYTIPVKTTKGRVALLHVLKADAGFTNLNSYMLALIDREITRRFGSPGTKRKHPVKSGS